MRERRERYEMVTGEKEDELCGRSRRCGAGQGNTRFNYFLVTGTYWKVINNYNPLLNYLYNTIL